MEQKVKLVQTGPGSFEVQQPRGHYVTTIGKISRPAERTGSGWTAEVVDERGEPQRIGAPHSHATKSAATDAITREHVEVEKRRQRKAARSMLIGDRLRERRRAEILSKLDAYSAFLAALGESLGSGAVSVKTRVEAGASIGFFDFPEFRIVVTTADPLDPSRPWRFHADVASSIVTDDAAYNKAAEAAVAAGGTPPRRYGDRRFARPEVTINWPAFGSVTLPRADAMANVLRSAYAIGSLLQCELTTAWEKLVETDFPTWEQLADDPRYCAAHGYDRPEGCDPGVGACSAERAMIDAEILRSERSH